MTKKDNTHLNTTLEYLDEVGELLTSDTEVDPHLELAGIQKALDNGPALLFNNIKGYPNARFAANIFSRDDRIAKIFDVQDMRELKERARQGFREPAPHKLVEDAPCQEVVITEDINVWDVVPMISHTSKDSGRTLGGGISCVVGKYFQGGSHIGFNRMSFLPDRKDYSSFQIAPGSHMWQIATRYYKKEPIPLTMCMGLPPACYLVAGSGFNYLSLPEGADEIGLAGAIQGSPIELVKARTVDAYAIANSQFVIEGYLDTTQRVWETPEAEAAQKQGVFPFHPEWSGYLGRAYRTYKFQVTAITYRQDRPIYYSPIVHGYDDHNINGKVREASFIELADRICPGLVIDAHIPLGMTDWGGVIFQVRKRSRFDQGYQKNILAATIAFSQGMRLAIAVDDDIDIYNAEDVLWALTTRVEPDQDIQFVAPGGRGQTFQPAERASAAPSRERIGHETRYAGGIAIDATVPFAFKDIFERPSYPVDRTSDLQRWFSEEDLRRAQAIMGGYARFLARTGI
jgi:4-hydroxy-3-polyprenylbenzoate decarboxylase